MRQIAGPSILIVVLGTMLSASNDDAVIRQRLQEWVEQANSGRLKEAATIWAPDLVGWFPGLPDDTYEREQEYAARAIAQGKPHPTFELTINEIMISGDIAVVRDTWVMTIPGAGAKPPSQLKFHSFEVWQRQPDKTWKIARWISAPEA